jgi:hypothetical protein
MEHVQEYIERAGCEVDDCSAWYSIGEGRESNKLTREAYEDPTTGFRRRWRRQRSGRPAASFPRELLTREIEESFALDAVSVERVGGKLDF